MKDMIATYDLKQLKSYKGYEIWKIWDVTFSGRKVNIQYEVADEDDAIDFFKTLAEARAFIDNVLV